LPKQFINGIVKWRTNAKVHAFNAKTGLLLCGADNDGALWATPNEVTCRTCKARLESLNKV